MAVPERGLSDRCGRKARRASPGPKKGVDQAMGTGCDLDFEPEFNLARRNLRQVAGIAAETGCFGSADTAENAGEARPEDTVRKKPA
jgi:hypothetical protein